MKKNISGFTIVELIIVIVVIGILASITIVAYSGIQNRAKDTRRKNDIVSIQKALEYYSAQNKGSYPPSTGSTIINPYWVTTADASWASFINSMEPYANIPSDPVSTPGIWSGSKGFNYSYYNARDTNSTRCGSRVKYMLVYTLASEANGPIIQGGACPENDPGDYPGSTTITFVGP